MRVHLEQEDTQEKEAYLKAREEMKPLQDITWKLAEQIVRRHYTDDDVAKAQYLQDKFENVDTIAKDSCFHFHYMGEVEGKDYDNKSIKVARVGDNLTIAFQTNEAIDMPGLELRFGGTPASGTGELKDDNASFDSGRYWRGSYVLSDNDSGVLSFHVSGTDRAGNQIKINVDEVLDSDLDSNKQSFSVYSGKTIKADSVAPELSSINIVERSEQSAFEYGSQTNRVVKAGDNLSIYFMIDESVDNDSLKVELMVGTDNRSDLVEVNKLNTNDGKSWEASYRIRDNDTGLLEWTIGAKDPAGNALVKADNVSSVSSLKIDWFDNKTDVWSAGIILYMLLSDNLTWPYHITDSF